MNTLIIFLMALFACTTASPAREVTPHNQALWFFKKDVPLTSSILPCTGNSIVLQEPSYTDVAQTMRSIFHRVHCKPLGSCTSYVCYTTGE